MPDPPLGRGENRISEGWVGVKFGVFGAREGNRAYWRECGSVLLPRPGAVPAPAGSSRPSSVFRPLGSVPFVESRSAFFSRFRLHLIAFLF